MMMVFVMMMVLVSLDHRLHKPCTVFSDGRGLFGGRQRLFSGSGSGSLAVAVLETRGGLRQMVHILTRRIQAVTLAGFGRRLAAFGGALGGSDGLGPGAHARIRGHAGVGEDLRPPLMAVCLGLMGTRTALIV